MKIELTTLDGVYSITPDVFRDHRGLYVETFNAMSYAAAFKVLGLPPIEFVQDDVSVSHMDVLRGLHGDAATWKLK